MALTRKAVTMAENNAACGSCVSPIWVDERLDHGTHEYEEGILILIPSLKPFFIKFLRDLVIGGPNPRMYTLRYGGSFMAG